jgi:hypothetical protein
MWSYSAFTRPHGAGSACFIIAFSIPRWEKKEEKALSFLFSWSALEGKSLSLV